MASNAHTRRAMLGAIAAVPMLTTVGGAIAAPSTEWDRTMVEYESARTAYDKDGMICDRVSARWKELSPKPEDVDLSGLNSLYVGRRLALLHTEDLDRWEQGIRGTKGIMYPDDDRLMNVKLAAVDNVRRYRADHERIDRAIGYSVAHDRNEALLSAMCDAEDRLMALPAPHGQALAWKLRRLIVREHDDCLPIWQYDYVAPILKDAERLLETA